MDDTSFAPAAEMYNESPKKSKKILRIFIIIIILLALGVAVFSFLGNPFAGPTPTPTPTQTPTKTPSPTASPSATPAATGKKTPTTAPTTAPKPTTSSGLDRSAISIEVQNGSGVAGVGAKAADFLKGLGYTISSTGNADNFDYQGVTISVKPTFSKYLTQLKADLSGEYTVGATSSNLATGSADAVVIIGK